MTSPGSVGFGDESRIEEGSPIEAFRRIKTEAAVELSAPDLSELEDIGAASFGPPPRLEAVIGTDERVQMKE